MTGVRESQRGFAYALAAYAMWGFFPLYWPLLEPTPAVQILAHRMVSELESPTPAQRHHDNPTNNLIHRYRQLNGRP